MNYLALYKRLIKSRKKLQEQRLIEQKNGLYFEDHHIIPVSICKYRNKTKKQYDRRSNHVLLTAKEHFMAHLLLYKACIIKYNSKHIYTVKCLYAVKCFISRKASTRADYKINSKIYEKLRENHSKMLSMKMRGEGNHMYGNTHTEEVREIISKKKKELFKDKTNNPMYGRTGLKSPHFNKPKTEKHKEKLRQLNLGRKMPKHCTGKNNHAYLNQRKQYIIQYTNGIYQTIYGLYEFCRDNGYDPAALLRVSKHINKYHKDICYVLRL